MAMKKRIIILVVSLIIVTGIIIGVSYAFFSTGGTQEAANTFQSGCLNISLTDASASINLNNIYPITDIEGLDTTSYDFTITNTCNTDANYEINLESLNKVSNSLSADYIKVSLSSDTVGNVISILSDNTSVTPEIENAYEAYDLYTGTLKASETKTYHLKLWLDYDATVEVAANKVYQSKINVIANPDIQVVDNLEATFELNDKTLTSNLTSNVTSATYCTTTDNICTPNTSATISNNKYNIDLSNVTPTKQIATVLGNITVNVSSSQMVCTQLNGTSKLICSNPEETSLVDFSKTAQASCSDTSTCEETNGIYEETTSKGTTYYWRGAVDNNWVRFADKYWRIIRINEDGSLRLIYSGDGSPQITGEGTQLGLNSFNRSFNNNTYVGLKYTINDVQGTETNSTILTILNTWYTNNLSSYSDKIDGNAGFCNDRIPAIGTGLGTTTTYYATYNRLVSDNIQPTFECSNSRDLFTTSGSSQGNKALQYPIGLITADEVAYAGGVEDTPNKSYYLFTDKYYWTMSPSLFSYGSANVFAVDSEGWLLGSGNVGGTRGIRPVINLKADVTISGGDGTSSNPYVIAI